MNQLRYMVMADAKYMCPDLIGLFKNLSMARRACLPSRECYIYRIGQDQRFANLHKPVEIVNITNARINEGEFLYKFNKHNFSDPKDFNWLSIKTD